MTSPESDSTFFDSYVPVYDEIPEGWEDARAMLVEALKRISNAINIREIGWFLDEELLSGKQYIPSPNSSVQQFRTVFRYVAEGGPLIAGANVVNVPVVFDNDFQLIDLWVSATNSATLHAVTMSNPDTVSLDNSTTTTSDVTITSPGVFDRSTIVIEYIQET